MTKRTFLAGKTFSFTARQRGVWGEHSIDGESPVGIEFPEIISKDNFEYYLILDDGDKILDSRFSYDYLYRILVGQEVVKSSKKVEKGVIRMLKKITNFVDGLKEPKKTYMRLGWIEVASDNWVVTELGREAVSEALLIEGLSLEEYAKKELARLEEEEKKSKKK